MGGARTRRGFIAAAIAMLLIGVVNTGLIRPANAAPKDPTVTIPGTEYTRAVACISPTQCLVIAANTSSPLNGESDTVVPVNPSGNYGNPINLNDIAPWDPLTEAIGVDCNPGEQRCYAVGDNGSLGGSFEGLYVVFDMSSGSPQVIGQGAPQVGALSSVSCALDGNCIAAASDGVAYVDGPRAGTGVPNPGLDGTSIACASSTQCLVVTAQQTIVPFNPDAGTFGTPQPWAAAGFTAHISCYLSHCFASAPDSSSGNKNSTIVSVDAATGAVSNQQSVSGIDATNLTCFASGQCLVVGSQFSGTYPNITAVPGTLSINRGRAGHVTTINGTNGSNGLAGVGCVEVTSALTPHQNGVSNCLAVGATAASGGPGIANTGIVLPLKQDGHVGATFAPTTSSLTYAAMATGELATFNPEWTTASTSKTPWDGCTATVVPSPTQDLVITAAHCVKELDGNGSKSVHTKFVFAPQHSGLVCGSIVNNDCPDLSAQSMAGHNPVGLWTAGASDVTYVPFVDQNQRLDFAFIHVHPEAGELPVERVVGGMNLHINPNRVQTWNIFGYPLQGDGTAPLKTCSGTSQANTSVAVAGDLGPVGMTITNSQCASVVGGASGGPWVDSNFLIGAVNKASGGDTVLGTYLANEVAAAYRQATHNSTEALH